METRQKLTPEAAKKSADDQALQRFLSTIKTFVDSHDDIQQILQASQSWADTEVERKEKAKAWAFRIAAGAVVFAVGALWVAHEAIQTAMVPPPPPQVLVMNETTGAINPLMSLTEVKVKYEDAVLRRALNTFSICRERYIRDMAESDYFCAASFMSPQLQSQWAKYWDSDNPNGPLTVYANRATVKPTIESISPRTNNQGIVDTAQIYFQRTVTENGVPNVTHWVADVSFKMVNLPKEEAQRRVNDIGLQITQYTTNQVLTASSGATRSQAPAAVPAAPRQGLSAPAYSPNQGRE
ncbi:VirB8/TrbF family protein [Pseudomonas fluorescens]|uniref:VirB8/TrbF family protein n=1 Tax=Pseudomonas fluorescens TaxID=294 RepID=UPI00372D6F7C